MHHSYLGSLLAPFFLAILAIPLLQRISLKIGFVDRQSDPQPHKYPIPLGGGLAIFVGLIIVVIGFTAFLPFSDYGSAKGLLAGAILIFVIGSYDDIYRMGIWSRMLGQIIAALIFLAFLERVPPVISLPVYLAFGVIWIVGISNAFDFLDNMDGLCTGVSTIIALGLGLLFVLRDMPLFAIISFALAGGALGFLRYNLPPAGIHLGKTGSLLFGYMLSCLAIVHLISSGSLSIALSPLLIMAYPIFDLTFVTVSRLSEGRKVYVGGKDHSSNKITFLGLTSKATVFSILLVNLLLVFLGVVLFFIAESPYQTIILVALALILAFVGTHLYRNILYLRHKILFLLADVVAINLAIVGYLIIKNHQVLLGPTYFIVPKDLIIPLAWINIFWILIYSAGGLYDLPIELRFRSHIKALLRLIVIGAVIFTLATYRGLQGIQISSLFSNPLVAIPVVFRQAFQVSLGSLGLFAVILFVCSIVFRLALYSYLGRWLNRPACRLEAAIAKLHSGPLCASTLHFFYDHYRIRGYVGEPPSSFDDFLGPCESLGDVLRESHIARVILDLPPDNYDNLTPVFESGFYMETGFMTNNPKSDNLNGLRKYATRYEGIFLVTSSQNKIFGRLLKRIIDFFVSSALLIICSPWVIFRLLWAKYKKVDIIHEIVILTRSGKEKKVKCSIGVDALSRFRNPWGLISVFKGDFSLVGATITVKGRAPSCSDPEIRGEWRKYLFKPGLFGPGYRGKSARERFDRDLGYIEKASLFRDLSVIFGQMLKSWKYKGDKGA